MQLRPHAVICCELFPASRQLCLDEQIVDIFAEHEADFFELITARIVHFFRQHFRVNKLFLSFGFLSFDVARGGSDFVILGNRKNVCN